MTRFSTSKALAALLSVLIFACTKPDGPEIIVGDDTEVPPANPQTPSQTSSDYFLFGSNMAWYQGWNDEQIAEILIGNPSKNITGAGVNSLRPAMYEHFVEQWGYDIRSGAFAFYKQLGAKDNTIFLGYPNEAHRDKTKYCGNEESKTFANLYEPIWNSDGSVNNNNYYAKYVYNVVKTYGQYVKFWEVWNEPDYTYNWGATQTWSTQNPSPCDLPGFNAPIQHYVRMLRITHEVVKSIDPKALVCVGGLGYETFLDAVLRNTDNPADGSVNADYPKKGGDWFDCVSYHIYPMYQLSAGNKNSDAAANVIVNQKKAYENVLAKYNYPVNSKQFVVTECNIPRKAIDGFIGSDEAQRNFLIKAAVSAQKAGIRGIYVYGVGDDAPYEQANNPYHVMGFYKQINSAPYQVTQNSSATSWRVTSTLLKDRLYSASQTTLLQLPAGIEGGAFYSPTENNFVYVLWAKNSGDTEQAFADYTFPSGLNINATTVLSWSGNSSGGSNSVSLTGAPVFVIPK